MPWVISKKASHWNPMQKIGTSQAACFSPFHFLQFGYRPDTGLVDLNWYALICPLSGPLKTPRSAEPSGFEIKQGRDPIQELKRWFLEILRYLMVSYGSHKLPRSKSSSNSLGPQLWLEYLSPERFAASCLSTAQHAQPKFCRAQHLCWTKNVVWIDSVKGHVTSCYWDCISARNGLELLETWVTWDYKQLSKTQQQEKHETVPVEMRWHNNILQSPCSHVALSIVLCASCFWTASDSCSSKLATLKRSTSFNSTCGARLAELILQSPRVQQFGLLAEAHIAPCAIASGLSATRPAAPTTSCAWGHEEKEVLMRQDGALRMRLQTVSCGQFTSNSNLI